MVINWRFLVYIFNLIGLLAILVIAFQVDDKIDPEVADFIELSEPSNSNEAFIYLMGIFAADGSEPEQVGQAIFKKVTDGPKSYFYGNDILFTNGLPLPSSDETCDLTEAECIDGIYENRQKFIGNKEKYDLLMARYDRFMSFREYKTMNKADINASIPPYSYLSRANRIFLIDSIATYSVNNSDEILTNISNIRANLASVDTIIGKMVFLKMLEENIAVLVSSHKPFKIAKLSKEERSLYVHLAREFKPIHDLYKSSAKNKAFFGYYTDGLSSFNENVAPLWFIRIFYKPNMTINSNFVHYKRFAERSELSREEFNRTDEIVTLEKSYIRNYAGSALSVGGPDFGKYTKRFFKLNDKILALGSVE